MHPETEYIEYLSTKSFFEDAMNAVLIFFSHLTQMGNEKTDVWLHLWYAWHSNGFVERIILNGIQHYENRKFHS